MGGEFHAERVLGLMVLDKNYRTVVYLHPSGCFVVKGKVMDRKKEIINATLGLAAENGLGTVSMQQIADKVGITKASLYNHFSSKEQLVEAMYEYLREVSKSRTGIGELNYDELSDDLTLRDILTGAVENYKRITSDPQMFLFYKVIMSERSINSSAAEIMVKETKTMINATKTLFYALQIKGIAVFENADSAAVSFAMGIHALLDYENDMEHSGMTKDEKLMQDFINEFCRIYEAKGDKKNGE